MAQKTYGIDFGTGTIKIYKKGNGIVKLERNVVSLLAKRISQSPLAKQLMKCMKKNRQAFMFLFHCSMA